MTCQAPGGFADVLQREVGSGNRLLLEFVHRV